MTNKTLGLEDAELASLLSQLNITYRVYHHPPLHDCQEADRLKLVRSGQRTKSLFLRDNYGKRHFLLITGAQASVDLKALSRQLKVSRLGFASSQRLLRYLGVAPGHVSLLALVKDPERAVQLLIDRELWQGECLQCHPLDNRTTWVLSLQDIECLLAYWRRPLELLTVPKLVTGS
ncbi:prolyl-tRNA synthetase associated domain-containing protein [Ferrimonas gelatinilytica]|uniref:Prolyl-tRNA synthetase associated domain-containing protein n=1 Tax=Ferrimonas gelatinilytica TaxID=1255257 RepID=A0ABP9S461_9GAMM